MHIPVELCARAEGGVDAREQVAADGWCNVLVGGVVECVCKDYFVVVQWEGAQVQIVGERFDVFDEGLRAREGEGVVHRGTEKGGSGR